MLVSQVSTPPGASPPGGGHSQRLRGNFPRNLPFRRLVGSFVGGAGHRSPIYSAVVGPDQIAANVAVDSAPVSTLHGTAGRLASGSPRQQRGLSIKGTLPAGSSV